MKRTTSLSFLLGSITLVAGTCAAWISVASAQIATTEPPFGAPASFRVDKPTLRARGASPALIEKVDASAFRYFRLLARQFAARTCFEFRELRWRLPFVAVHGDAHVEQFVITEHSYGLEDFDQAGFGPAVVDIVRYAASLHVACRQVGWPCNADEAVSAYFDAYHAALDQPVDRSQPAIADRLHANAPQDQHAWLQWAESLMQPLPASDEQAFRKGWERFVQLMRETSPDRSDGFYRISRLGRIDIGVGSALEPKILIRVAGPTDAGDDDLMLEARNTVTPTGQECVSRPANGGSLQVLMFASLLGPRLPEVFGFLPREGAREAPELWVQSWDRGYRELSIADLRSQTDLNELAVDAGRQLAGHFWTRFPEPLRGHQRFAQLRAFEMTSTRARVLARRLADETVTEWERFKRQR
jgi:uncharacterized protein DUF2252